MDELDLPTNTRPATIFGFIAALEYETTAEFSQFLENQFAALNQSHWFKDLRDYRLSQGQPFMYKNPKDLRFILGEAVLHDSWIWDLIPNMDKAWVNNADALRKKLNQFHHLQLRPDLATLSHLARLFELVTDAPGLEIASKARAIRARAKKIEDNSYVADVAPTGEGEGVESVLEERPPWGSRWKGAKPRRKLNLNRQTREIFDGTGKLVTTELGADSEEIINTWLRYYPMGGEIWVADDGAVMGYIKGIPKMIGWFGNPPDKYKESVRGFVLAHEYTFDGSDIIDNQSNRRLSKSATDDISALIQELSEVIGPGEQLQISEFGDLFVPLPEGQPERFAWAHKNVWFPGHLPE